MSQPTPQNAALKQIITPWVQLLQQQPLGPESSQAFQDAVNQVVQIEVAALGYRYQPGAPDNTFAVDFTSLPLNDKRHGCFVPRGFDEQPDYQPQIQLNHQRLYQDFNHSDAAIRLQACREYFHTVFHELQHFRQALMTETNVSSYDSLLFARDHALDNLLDYATWNHLLYPATDSNYWSAVIEKDAEVTAFQQLTETGFQDPEVQRRLQYERAKLHLGTYKADTRLASDGTRITLDERRSRDNITVPILDFIITQRHDTRALTRYPILQKEYNLDGSKKDAVTLAQNLQTELQEYDQDQALTADERETLKKDARQMYYELLYRELAKDPDQTAKLQAQFGTHATTNLLTTLQSYFHEQHQFRLDQSAKWAEAVARSGEIDWQTPVNNGKINLPDGRAVTCQELLGTLDKKLVSRRLSYSWEPFILGSVDGIIQNLFYFLPESGQVTLTDGTKIGVQKYLETYLDDLDEIATSEEATARELVQKSMQISPWEQHQFREQQLNQQYAEKQQILTQRQQLLTPTSDRERA